MADTYSQIYIHIVFSPAGRHNLIMPEFKTDLHKYICGIIQNKKQKLMAINSMPDHIHLLVSINPAISISELVRDIKANSSRFINSQNWLRVKFNWQNGFGAFSCSKSHAKNVIRYIYNQEHHHEKESFREEYLRLLKKYEIVYNENYLFEWVE